MYRCAKPEKKKAAGGLLLSAALACMATGITEPIEFSFLFVAPMLFVVQVILAGSAYMIAHILNIAVGLTFYFHCSTDRGLPEWHIKYMMQTKRNQGSLN